MWEPILTSFIGSFVQAVLFRIRLIEVRKTRRVFQSLRVKRRSRPNISQYSRINQYIKDVLTNARTVDFVSRRLSWVDGDPTMAQHIRSLAEQGTVFRFYIQSDNQTAQRLREGQRNIRVTVPAVPNYEGEWPRFLLINRTYPGPEVLYTGSQEEGDWRAVEFRGTESAGVMAIAYQYLELFEQTGRETS